jgi:ubiquinol-cytochrome c reductase cytochrome b subunit
MAAFITGVLVYYGYQAPWSPVFVGPGLADVPSLPAKAMVNLNPTQMEGAKLMHLDGCLACHTVEGVGGQRGPDLTYVGDRLNDVQLTWRIAHGGTNMPAFGNTLSTSKLSALVSYLETRTSGGSQAGSASGP